MGIARTSTGRALWQNGPVRASWAMALMLATKTGHSEPREEPSRVWPGRRSQERLTTRHCKGGRPHEQTRAYWNGRV